MSPFEVTICRGVTMMRQFFNIVYQALQPPLSIHPGSPRGVNRR